MLMRVKGDRQAWWPSPLAAMRCLSREEFISTIERLLAEISTAAR
jgi:hypothetical protein